MILLHFPGLGAVVLLETRAEPNRNVYWITVGMYPSCTCLDFTNMAISATGGRQQYKNCKQFYYLFRYFCKMDIHKDKFIHAANYTFHELKFYLIKARIITVLYSHYNFVLCIFSILYEITFDTIIAIQIVWIKNIMSFINMGRHL